MSFATYLKNNDNYKNILELHLEYTVIATISTNSFSITELSLQALQQNPARDCNQTLALSGRRSCNQTLAFADYNSYNPSIRRLQQLQPLAFTVPTSWSSAGAGE
jgi:hypothetical protein